jgi:D-lactate dehydrogenase
MLHEKYEKFRRKIAGTVPKNNIITDLLRTITFGTDASFYRLIPKMVINVQNEKEVRLIPREAHALRLPVTFRAAGTCLSGPVITEL